MTQTTFEIKYTEVIQREATITLDLEQEDFEALDTGQVNEGDLQEIIQEQDAWPVTDRYDYVDDRELYAFTEVSRR